MAKRFLTLSLSVLLVFGLIPSVMPTVSAATYTCYLDKGSVAVSSTGAITGKDSSGNNVTGTLTASDTLVITETTPGTATANTITINSSTPSASLSCTVKLSGVNMSGTNGPFVINSSSTWSTTLNLKIAGTNTIASTPSSGYKAGITVTEWATLNISSDSGNDSTDTLTVTSGRNSAAIGGSASPTNNCGTINISGGTITAGLESTSNRAAAIGGYTAGSGVATVKSGTINISGGIVNATSNDGAAIGSGATYNASATYPAIVNISGGTVVATTSNTNGASAIGAGTDASSSTTANSAIVTITGGNITAQGKYQLGKGTANGTGTVYIKNASVLCKNTSGTAVAFSGALNQSGGSAVYLTTVKVPTASASTALNVNSVAFTVKSDASSNIYLYLPTGTYSGSTATIGGITYTQQNSATVDNSGNSTMIINTPPVAPTLINNVQLSGTMVQGKTITGSYSYTYGVSEGNSSYRLLRYDYQGGAYTIIASGPTKATTCSSDVAYIITSSDVGKYIVLEITPKASDATMGQKNNSPYYSAVLPLISYSEPSYIKNGTDITEIGLLDGNITISLNVTNNSGTLTPVTLIVAIYKNNKCLNLKSISSNVPSDGNTTPLSVILSVPTDYKNYNVKIFTWDSVKGVKPLKPTYNVPSQAEVAGVYQYFLPDNGSPVDGTYLWIPPKTTYIKGIILANDMMIPNIFFESPIIRALCEKNSLAIMQLKNVSGLFTHDLTFAWNYNDPAVIAKFESILSSLAAMSGYPEIVNAPFIPTAHSATASFVYNVALYKPEKCLAMAGVEISLKTLPADKSTALANVPYLYTRGIQYEWDATVVPYGDNANLDAMSQYRKNYGYNEGGALIDYGGGHFDWTERKGAFIAEFIDKVCKYRLPESPNADGTITLINRNETDGWLVDPSFLYNSGANATASYANYTGDKSAALWYIDQQFAQDVTGFMTSEYNKQPQMFTFMNNGTPYVFTVGRAGNLVHLTYTPDADGRTFTITPSFLDAPPSNSLGTWPVSSLSHSNEAVKYTKMIGQFQQVGENTFKAGLSRYFPTPGSVIGYIIGYMNGDSTFRGAVCPADISTTAPTGTTTQTITFPELYDINSAVKTVTLNATASSGLPVDYFMVSGPAIIKDGKLLITQIPAKSQYPIKVTLAAYQWGNATYKATAPVYRSFNIYK